MPVDCDSFHAPMLIGGVNILAGIVDYNKQKDQPCKNVKGVHTGHHVEDRARRTTAGGKTFSGGGWPFHSNDSEQEAKTKHKSDQGIGDESFFITVRHGSLAAIHEEGRNQEHCGHRHSKELIQVRTG